VGLSRNRVSFTRSTVQGAVRKEKSVARGYIIYQLPYAGQSLYCISMPCFTTPSLRAHHIVTTRSSSLASFLGAIEIPSRYSVINGYNVPQIFWNLQIRRTIPAPRTYRATFFHCLSQRIGIAQKPLDLRPFFVVNTTRESFLYIPSGTVGIHIRVFCVAALNDKLHRHPGRLPADDKKDLLVDKKLPENPFLLEVFAMQQTANRRSASMMCDRAHPTVALSRKSAGSWLRFQLCLVMRNGRFRGF
jgi:hypothetical protein